MGAKIKELVDRKFWLLLRESEASLELFGPSPPMWIGSLNMPSVISAYSLSQKQREEIMSRWDSYIGGFGMRRVCSPCRHFDGRYILDPAMNWFNAGVPLELFGPELYIEIPRELALKILVLGLP
jgi:hypothetical protein